jgi:hypothetical protein
VPREAAADDDAWEAAVCDLGLVPQHRDDPNPDTNGGRQ